jgi:hypothetical protein
MWAIRTRHGYYAPGLVRSWRTTPNRSEAARYASIENAQEVIREHRIEGGWVVPADEDRK